MTDILNAIPEWIQFALLLVPAAKAITMFTATEVDNKILNGVLSALNFMALNIGKDKNADTL